MSAVARAILCGMALGVRLGSTGAADRVALLIGNGAYEHTTILPNPPNDGRAMAAALRRLGFDVIEGADLDYQGTRRALRDFGRKLDGAEVGLFFYAGHGLQVGGENWLVPVDAELADEADLELETINLSAVIGQLERTDRTNLVFLDACRDNPLARRMARRQSSRSVSSGLAEVKSGQGTLIAFATQPGNVALDGDGVNSPFTTALLAHLETPGQDVDTLMGRVRKDVHTMTKGRQVRWAHTSLLDEFHFVPIARPDMVPTDDRTDQTEPTTAALGRNTVEDRGTLEQTLWESGQKITEPANRRRALEEYLARFPDGAYAGVARIQIDDLGAAAGEAARGAAPDRQARELVRDAVLLAAKIAEDGRKLHAATTTASGAAAQLEVWREALADLPPEVAERSTRSADIQRVEQRLRVLQPRTDEHQRGLADSFQDYLGLVAALGASTGDDLDALLGAAERELSEGAEKHLVSERQFALLRAHLQEWRERDGQIDGEVHERWLEGLDERRRERLELATIVPKLAPSP